MKTWFARGVIAFTSTLALILVATGDDKLAPVGPTQPPSGATGKVPAVSTGENRDDYDTQPPSGGSSGEGFLINPGTTKKVHLELKVRVKANSTETKLSHLPVPSGEGRQFVSQQPSAAQDKKGKGTPGTHISPTAPTTPKSEPRVDPAEEITRSIELRLAQGGSRTWLLPVFTHQSVAIVPSPSVTSFKVKVVLSDCLKHPLFADAIRKGLIAEGIARWEPVEPIEDTIGVRLYTKVNGMPVMLSTARLAREAGRVDHELEFEFEVPITDATVRKQIEEKNLGLAFEESYQGRYVQSDMTATLSSTTEATAAFRNILTKGSGGKERAVLVAFGGTVRQDLAFQQLLRQLVSVRVQTRLGAKVDPALLDRVIGKLIDAGIADAAAKELAHDQLVTFIFSNGVKVSGVLGEFKKLTTDDKVELKRRIEHEQSWEVIGDTKREIKVKGEGSILEIIKAGAEGSGRWEDYDKNAGSNKTVSVAEDMKAMSRAVEGSLPVVALNAEQLQKLVSASEKDIQLAIESFSYGEKTLTHRVSLRPPSELTLSAVSTVPFGPTPAEAGTPPPRLGDLKRLTGAALAARSVTETKIDPNGKSEIVYEGHKYVFDASSRKLSWVPPMGLGWNADVPPLNFAKCTLSLCTTNPWSGNWLLRVLEADGGAHFFDARTGFRLASLPLR